MAEKKEAREGKKKDIEIKDSDYIKVDGILTIRKSVPPLMRIVVKDKVGKNELKGTIKFSSMIPIPDIALLNYDVTKEEDETYKILVLKEISFINSNSEAIIKKKIYIK